VEFSDHLRRHLDRVKPIIYCSILAVGIPQIIIREYFPELHPPWPLIGYSLMIILFGLLLIPPLRLAFRLRKNRRAGRPETHG
jgi:hypothetical protein